MAAIFPMAILVVVSLAVILRLLAGDWDHDRVRQYTEARGGALRSIAWTPFGPGWFGNDGARLYRVAYVDADGFEHDAFVKTSMLAGVYFTEDVIVGPHADLPPPDPDAELLAENEALRAEIERLRTEGA